MRGYNSHCANDAARRGGGSPRWLAYLNRKRLLESLATELFKEPFLKDLGKFVSESTPWLVIPLFSAAAISSVDSLIRSNTIYRYRSRNSHRTLDCTLGGLSGVGAKNLIFERGSVETADD